ncbi:MAG: hypothetical protein Q9217_005195, partial [Psora testacea]
MAYGAPPDILHRQIVEEVNSKKLTRIADASFNELSKALRNHLQNSDFAIRPRTWFILFQINRVDVMHAFIIQGLTDASLPYKERRSLPPTLNPEECREFFKLQELVMSEGLDLESGRRVRFNNGDEFFKKVRTLGTGQQGASQVDEVVSIFSGKTYARKRIDRRKMFGHDKSTQKVYENELDSLTKIRDHDHLIRVCGIYTDKKYFAMLLEPVADIDLKEYMRLASPMIEAQEPQFRAYFGCLAHTLKYLHEPPVGIIHKDIKPANVLLKNGRLILTDFGTAFDWSQTGQSMTRSNASDARTARYMSPEVAHCGEFHRSSDIWSLGIVFLEMVTILRGKSIPEMDEYVLEHGNKTHNIYNNLEAAMGWFDVLERSRQGSSMLDNEPIAWIKSMLHREHTHRPSASVLCETIRTSQVGKYCGQCCLDTESDSESELSLISDSDVDSETVKPRISYQSAFFAPNHEHGATVPATVKVVPHLPPPNLPLTTEPRPQQEISLATQSHLHDISGIRTPTGVYQDPDIPRPAGQPEISSSSIKETEEKIAAYDEPREGRKTSIKNQSKPFFTKKDIVKWLAMSREKFKVPVQRRKPNAKRSVSQVSESQRIGHFLSSLPESSAGYMDPSVVALEEEHHMKPFTCQNRSQTMAVSPEGDLKRTLSQEDLPSSSHELHEDGEDSQFAEADFTRPVHSSSETDLRLARALSDGNSKKIIEDLKKFAATTLWPDVGERGATQDKSLTPETPCFPPSMVCEAEAPATTVKLPEMDSYTNSLRKHLHDLRGPGLEHLARNTRMTQQATLIPPVRLEDYVASDESAKDIRAKFLGNKVPGPATTVMSEKT